MNQELVDAPIEPLPQQWERIQQQFGWQAVSQVQEQPEQAATAAPPTPHAATYTHTQPRSRPEYALFLASMAWLHHDPERQQYKTQLYACFDFNAMRDNELSQVSRWGMLQRGCVVFEVFCLGGVAVQLHGISGRFGHSHFACCVRCLPLPCALPATHTPPTCAVASSRGNTDAAQPVCAVRP